MNRLLNNPVLKLIDDQVSYFNSHNLGRLQFAKDLEERYERDHGSERSLRMSFDGLLILIIYNLFLISDYYAMPQRMWLAVLLRSIVFTPIGLCVYALLRQRPVRMVREGSIVLLAGLAAGCDMVLYHHVSDGVSTSAPISLMLILLVVNIVMRLQFLYAVLTTILCNLTLLLFLLDDPFLDPVEKVHLGGLVFWGGVFILIANYSLDRETRRNYLLSRSRELQATLLKDAYRDLQAMSSQDGLTRLANRSSFDRKLAELWEQCRTTKTPLSAVMIDIDHFKVVNDTQGHLYGDEVLKRVATLVQQSLRGKEDFAARYGGEEFVLLLPDTDRNAAIKVAERVRSLVQTAGSPAPSQPVPRPEVGLWTTVSCGVATVMDATEATARGMLLAADTALYTAKAEGRNRVCSAEPLGVKQPQD